MIRTSSSKALGWGMALFPSGAIVALFFFVAGLPTVGLLGGLVAIAGWVCLSVGVTDLASKADALYQLHMTSPEASTKA